MVVIYEFGPDVRSMTVEREIPTVPGQRRFWISDDAGFVVFTSERVLRVTGGGEKCDE